MITRVAIRGYKSLENVDIELHPLTVIFGPNAAGKSNLFDALRLLSRMVTYPSLNQAFDDHRGTPLEAFHFGSGGLDALFRETANPTFTIEVDVQLGDTLIESVDRRIRQMREGLQDKSQNGSRRRITERRLRYRLTIEILTRSGLLRIVDEELQALRNDGVPRARSAFISRSEEGSRLVLRLEGQAHPTYYDVGMDHTIVSTSLYAPHYPHISAFKEELGQWRFYYLEPDRMRADTPLKEVEVLSANGADLAAFYNTLKDRNPRQFEAINRALHLLLPRADSFEVRRDNQGFLQLYVIEDGIPFSARSMSEGTLRLLGLLAITYSSTPATCIGYEEPENGVHPRRLKLIADLLHNAVGEHDETQVLINTHSPLLADDLADTYLLACQRNGQNTEFKRFHPIPLWKRDDIDTLLASSEVHPEEQQRLVSDLILRGAFGG